MNRRVLRPTIGLLLLAVGWGCTRDPTAPFIAFCTSQPSSAVAAFEDANLEAEIRAGLSVGSQEDLTCGLLETLTNLNAGHSGIASLAGIENLTSLTTLAIRGNSITDIGPLGGLTSLTFLNLAANSITDISALSGLTSLMFLAINANGHITDISPLSELTSLTGTLWIYGNSITDLNGLSGLTNLTTLNAWDNSITDISAVSGLTSLTTLRLHLNSITDLSVLRGPTNLTLLWLHNNSNLSNIQPLLENPAFGVGASVNLTSTNVSCTDVDALRAKGVAVIFDCP